MERKIGRGLPWIAAGALAAVLSFSAAALAAEKAAAKPAPPAAAAKKDSKPEAPPAPAAKDAAAPAGGLRAIRVKGLAGPLPLDAAAPFWKDAAPVAVAMQPQVVAVPMNPNPAVAELSVKAVHDGTWMAYLIEWADPSKSDRIVTDEFGDQVGVQIPVASGKDGPPSVTMGEQGGRVHIMQWRAAFQRDLEEGEPDIRDLYPYAHVDVYPDQVLRATDARPYMGAVGMDNPISHPKRSAVLDQMAEGFGTLTVEPDQHADGRGVWVDGRWRVVITHPLAAGGAGDPLLAPGDNTFVAFAVWEGGAKEVGARKAWADWVPLSLDP